MKKILLLILLINITLSAQANGTIDKILQSEYKEAYLEASKNLNLDKTAENYYNMCLATFYLNDAKEAKKYCLSGLNILDKEKHPDKELKSDINALIGNIYSNYYKNTDITFDYFNSAKQMKESNPDTDKFSLANLYLSIGKIYYQTGNKDLSLEYYNKSLKLCNNDNKKYNLIKAEIYNKLGEQTKEQKAYKEAEEYFKKGIEELNSVSGYKNIILEGILYKNLADVSIINKNKKTQTYTYYQKSFEILSSYPQIDIMEKNKTEKEVKEELEIFPYDINLNLKLGDIYLFEENTEAEKYFEKAIQVNPYNAETYICIAKSYANNYRKELNYYKQEAEKYINLAIENALQNKIIYQQGADIFNKLKMKKESEKLTKKAKTLT